MNLAKSNVPRTLYLNTIIKGCIPALIQGANRQQQIIAILAVSISNSSLRHGTGKDKVDKLVSITDRPQERHFRGRQSPAEMRCHRNGEGEQIWQCHK